MRIFVMLAILLSAPAAIAAQEGGAADEAQYVKEYKAGAGFTFDCFGAEEDKACVAMIDHYRAAMDAPDADEAVRHYIFKDYIHAKAVRASHFRENSEPEKALPILVEAYAEMMEHYDGGNHFHTLIDNLRMQQELYLTLAILGRADQAAVIRGNVRETGAKLYAQRDKVAGKEQATKVFNAGLIGSEEFETALADLHTERAKIFEAEGNAARAKAERAIAIEGWQRATDWVIRSAEAGIQGMMSQRGEIRVGNAQIALGSLLHDEGRDEEALEAFIYGGGFGCALAKDAEANKLDQSFGQSICNRASMGYLLASGKAAEIAREQSEAMYRQQMELLNTDIGPALEAMRKD